MNFWKFTCLRISRMCMNDLGVSVHQWHCYLWWSSFGHCVRRRLGQVYDIFWKCISLSSFITFFFFFAVLDLGVLLELHLFIDLHVEFLRLVLFFFELLVFLTFSSFLILLLVSFFFATFFYILTLVLFFCLCSVVVFCHASLCVDFFKEMVQVCLTRSSTIGTPFPRYDNYFFKKN